jgi:hypothetical protein
MRYRPARAVFTVRESLLVAGVAAAVVTVMMFVAFAVVLATVLEFPGPLLVGAALLLVFRGHRRHRRRLGAAGTAPLPRRPAPLPRPAPELAWSQARREFNRLRSAYAAHECDPMAVLRLPALSDVTVPSTGRFVEAFAEAQALETDAFPPREHAAAFVTAVEKAQRAWQAARDAAERIRLSRLSPDERHAVERVIKLLTTARDSDSDAERLTAYARARTELGKLDRAGIIHMPRTAQAALDVAGRGQLPA